jgi:hypothetical protein
MKQLAAKFTIGRIRPVLCGAAVLLVSVLPCLAFADGYWFIEAPVGSSDSLVETQFMKLGIHAAPWLPREISAMRSKQRVGYEPDTIALFRNTSGGQHLIIIWSRTSNDFDKARMIEEYFRVDESADGNVRLVRVDEGEAYSVTLVPPSGMAVFPNEPPVAVLLDYTGGAGWDSYQLGILEIGQKITGIGNPPMLKGTFRMTDVMDVDGDGKYELIYSDDGWSHYFSDRTTAGPYFPIIVERVNGKFELACRKHRAAYRRWIAERLEEAAKPQTTLYDRLEFFGNAVLGATQIGDFADARRYLDKLIANLEKMQPLPYWIPSVKAVRQDFNDLIAKAEPLADAQCIVEATGVWQSRYGGERG